MATSMNIWQQQAEYTCVDKPKVCLSIGGSDSSCGAGIQADLRMFAMQGVHGCSAITALTAQSYLQISRIEPVSLAQLDAELHTIFDAYDVMAVKTGMLFDAEHIAVVEACLSMRHRHKVLVIDPVMVASSGKRLLAAEAVETLRQTLIKQATIVTPNLDEAAVLLGRNVIDAKHDAQELSYKLGCAVLLKGGHASDAILRDIFADAADVCVFEHTRAAWNAVQSHGTGCRIAATLTALLAKQPNTALAAICEQAIQVLQNEHRYNG